MAIVAVLAVVTLVALLAVATLSVVTRLEQGSSLAIRDAKLDAATSFALATAIADWRQYRLSTLAVGGSKRLDALFPGNAPVTSVTVTRIAPALFWLVAEATALDASRRRENLVVRLALPRADSIPPLLVAGNVILSPQFVLARDTLPGCSPIAADLVVSPSASISSVGGAVSSLVVQRSLAVADSAALLRVGMLSLAAIASTADLTLGAGTITGTPSGVVHALGAITLTGGTGGGILIVDGTLTLAGPVSFSGLIVARGGIVTTAPGSRITGSIRTGPGLNTANADASLSHELVLTASACATQTAINNGVMPHPVAGRRWAEMF